MRARTARPRCPDKNGTTGLVSVCSIGEDCLSGYCDTKRRKCVDGNSCTLPASTKAAAIQDIMTQATLISDAVGTPNANGAGQLAGIDTCGVGESTDDPMNQTHESCCKSLDIAIPSEKKTIRYDKYEVTAGRMRQFIESVDAAEGGTGDIQDWVRAQFSTDGKYTPLTDIGVRLAKMIPTAPPATGKFQADVISLYPQTWGTSKPLNLVQQLGGTSIDDAHPSGEQGCYTSYTKAGVAGNGAGGAGTYWFDATDGQTTGEAPRDFTQDYYDVKATELLAVTGWPRPSAPGTAGTCPRQRRLPCSGTT